MVGCLASAFRRAPAGLRRHPEDVLRDVLVAVLRSLFAPVGQHRVAALLEGIRDVLQGKRARARRACTRKHPSSRGAHRPSPTTRPRSRLWHRCRSVWWPPSQCPCSSVDVDRERQKYDTGRVAVHLPGTDQDAGDIRARSKSIPSLTLAGESPTSMVTGAPGGRSPALHPVHGDRPIPRRPTRCPLSASPRTRMVDSQDETKWGSNP